MCYEGQMVIFGKLSSSPILLTAIQMYRNHVLSQFWPEIRFSSYDLISGTLNFLSVSLRWVRFKGDINIFEKHLTDFKSHVSPTRGDKGHIKMTSNIFATSNFNKLNMCGIRNPRTAHDARATNDLRITSGGRFLVVTVM